MSLVVVARHKNHAIEKRKKKPQSNETQRNSEEAKAPDYCDAPLYNSSITNEAREMIPW